jgi:preprotein translocase subunit SecD
VRPDFRPQLRVSDRPPNKWAAALVFVAFLVGCDEIDYVNAAPRHVAVKTDSPADIERTERVLSERFHQYLPSLFSSMESQRKADGIAFVFVHGAPARDVVEYLVNNRGHLVVTSSDGQVWFTEQDIEEALPAPSSDDYNALHVTLTRTAGARVARLSESSKGQTVQIAFDGTVLASPKVQHAISFRVSIPMKKEMTEVRLIATIIHSGPLPGHASIVSSDL